MSSVSADPAVALQDDNVLCLNHTDLTGTACILAVPGYGEEETKEDEKTVVGLLDTAATVRGPRPWRDVTGGASVCCTHCNAPLGFASLESPESFRLLKHRLSTIGHTGNDLQRLSPCASFLAREMVRYAEAKAIFTFVVTLDTPQMSFASNLFTKCILLRLVSWDCSIATSLDEESGRLKFERYAKIVFQETYDKRETKRGTWMWGGVDLCCPPMNLGGQNAVDEESSDDIKAPEKSMISTTRILLQEEEYFETLQKLREGQKMFTKDVIDATIFVKMGTQPTKKTEDGNGLGLTAVPLHC